MARSKWVCGNRWRTPSRSESRLFIVNVLCSRDIPYFEPHCPFSVVTQRCLWGGALRCVANYPAPDSYQVATYSFKQRNVERKIDTRKGVFLPYLHRCTANSLRKWLARSLFLPASPRSLPHQQNKWTHKYKEVLGPLSLQITIRESGSGYHFMQLLYPGLSFLRCWKG